MTDHGDIFIGGGWVPSASPGRLPVVNPATEETWAQVPAGGAADIDAAVAAARTAFPGWQATPPGDRAAAIGRLADEIEVRSAEFTRVITAENGTAVSESAAAPGHAAAHLRYIVGGPVPHQRGRQGAAGRRCRADHPDSRRMRGRAADRHAVR